MTYTNWADEIRRIDDATDEHLADDLALHVRGRVIPLRGTIRTEEGEIVEGASSYWGVRTYVSVASRHLPEKLDESAILEVSAPLDGGPPRYYRISLDRDLKTGRRKLFLRKTDETPADSCLTREQRACHDAERDSAPQGPGRTRETR